MSGNREKEKESSRVNRSLIYNDSGLPNDTTTDAFILGWFFGRLLRQTPKKLWCIRTGGEAINIFIYIFFVYTQKPNHWTVSGNPKRDVYILLCVHYTKQSTIFYGFILFQTIQTHTTPWTRGGGRETHYICAWLHFVLFSVNNMVYIMHVKTET